MILSNGSEAAQVSARQWWGRRRLRYNIGLTVAGLSAFACYLAAVYWGGFALSTPYPTATALPGMLLRAALAYLVFMAIANAFYFLGPLLERVVQRGNVARYRRITFPLAFWFSMLLPFTIPAVLTCFHLGDMVLHGSTPVARSELPGTYVADYGFATDAVTIRRDGRFVQEVKVKATGKVFVATGTWDFDPQDRHIQFDGIMVVVDYAGKMVPDFDKKRDGLVILPVRWLLGKMEIGGDDIPWGREGADIPHTKQANRP